MLLSFETRTIRKEQRDVLTSLGKMELQIELIPTGEIIRVVSRNGGCKTVSLFSLLSF